MSLILLTPRELAQRLDLSYETVLSMARRDEIPSIRDSRNRLVFNLDSVLQALRASSPRESGSRLSKGGES